MRKFIAMILCLASSLCVDAQTKMVFTPQWHPQSQFAGYYVALEKGFYKDEGLDVEIRHHGINSTESIIDQLLKGDAQVVGLQLIQSIIERSDGRKIVNVMQVTQKSGLCCVSRTPISHPKDLGGMKVARWKSGFAEVCDMMEVYNNISINWIPVASEGTNLFVYGAVDATLCYSFNELISLEQAVGEIPAENMIRISDFGFECPEDGLYVTEDYYNRHRDAVEAFVRASRRGWEYAAAHMDEAYTITRAICDREHMITNAARENHMLEEYLSLQTNPESGKADFSPVSKEVFDKITEALMYTGHIVRKPEYEEMIR